MFFTKDYPSVEQIREVFQKNIVVPVFAATSEFQSLFEQVAAAMEGSGAVTAIISQNSSNIIDVIQTAYLVGNNDNIWYLIKLCCRILYQMWP